MATYPTTVPDLVDLIYDTTGLPPDKFLTLLEEVQALMSAVGAQPGGSGGTVANAIAELQAESAAFGNAGYQNLRIVVASDTTITATADWLSVEGQRAESLNVTLDVTASGALGTAASRAVSTWFFVWIGVNETTGAATGILDDTHLRASVDTSHASLDGYDHWRRIGAVKTNSTGSGNFIRFTQEGNRVVYADPVAYSVVGPDATIGSGSPGTYDPVNVPPYIASLVHLGCEPAVVVVVPSKLMARRSGGTGGIPIVATPLGSTGNSGHWGTGWVAVSAGATPQIQAWWSTAGGSAGQNTAVLYTLGYHDSFLQ